MAFTVPDIIGRPVTFWAQDIEVARKLARIYGHDPSKVEVA